MQYQFIEQVDAKEHDAFVSKHELCNLLQSSSWGLVKENWKHTIVGVKYQNQLVASCMILIKPLPLGYRIASVIVLPPPAFCVLFPLCCQCGCCRPDRHGHCHCKHCCLLKHSFSHVVLPLFFFDNYIIRHFIAKSKKNMDFLLFSPYIIQYVSY